MDARDLQQIDAFLTDLGQASLLEYYGITADAPQADVKARIKAKRSWAQAQQANPKFRYQALWLIKNNSLVQRVLLEEMKAYVEAVAARERDRKLQMLDLFVQGSLVSGRLSSESEAAIRRQAAEMGLTEAETTRYLEDKVGQDDQESLFEADGAEPAKPDDNFIDYYELLRISPQATAEEVEEAYRERYRWARTLKDLQRANDIYKQLEQAWRILSDTTRRRDFDDQRRARKSAETEHKPSASSGPSPSIGFADPEPSEPPSELEPPSEIRLGRPQWAQDRPERGSPKPDPLTLAPRPEPEPSSRPKLPTTPIEPPAPTPTPPPDFRSRTFQPGTPEAPAKPRHTPRLSVQGPDQISLGLLFKPVVRTITVRNAGKGRLRGNVASSQPWLQVSPRTLHLRDAAQVIELRAFPGRLPGHSGRARVTISTTHGERWATNVDAYKRRVGRIAAGVITIAVLLLLVLDRQGIVPIGIFPPPGPEQYRTVLQLEVVPPDASILLDGRMAGKGPAKLLMDPVQPGQPLVLTVQHPDREPYVERMVFVDHQRIRRAVTLASKGQGPSHAVDQDTQRKIQSSHEDAPKAPEPTPPPPDPETSPESALGAAAPQDTPQSEPAQPASAAATSPSP